MKREKTKKRKIPCLVVLTVFMLFSIIGVALITVLLIGTISMVSQQLPSLDTVIIPPVKETTKIFSTDGELLADLYLENREYAQLREIPEQLSLAFIAIEDSRFFAHPGVDFKGILRAVSVNLLTGKKEQGASTITQQLVRNIYLSAEKTITRKLKEMILALALEKKYSKEEILEQYLNRIYFGHGNYGVKTATTTYFGKQMKNLTLAECALLAGLPKSPNNLSPYRNPAGALARRRIVLDKMLEFKFINRYQYASARTEPLKLRELTETNFQDYKAPYFVTYIKDQLTSEEGKFQLSSQQVFSEGYKIYTTLDMRIQKLAEDAVKYGMKLQSEQKSNISQMAIVAMEPSTGKILAMVGGVDFGKNQYNRVTQAHRQPGSSFKPFIYTTAVKRGHSMKEIVSDSPACFGIAGSPRYCPHNYDNKYEGSMTFERALYRSRNLPAVKVAYMVGIKNIIETAQEMGVKSRLVPNLSMALGTSEITPLEMVTAYSVIANGGRKIEPNPILKIENSSGANIYEASLRPGEEILDAYVIDQIVPAMEKVIIQGTGTRANIGRPAAGKTGTTSDFKDVWFIGFTPTLAAAVWAGNDNNQPMKKKTTGGAIPAPVWAYFMKAALEDAEIVDFKPKATTLSKTNINEQSQTATGTHQQNTENQASKLRKSQPKTEYIPPETFEFDNQTKEKRKNTEEFELIEPLPNNDIPIEETF